MQARHRRKLQRETSLQVRSTERGHHSAAPANQKRQARHPSTSKMRQDMQTAQCVPEVTRHIFVQPRVPVAPAQPRSNQKNSDTT